MSIRWRIALWNTAAFAVVLLGFGALVYGLLRQTHYQQIDQTLYARYREIAGDNRLTTEPEQAIQDWISKLELHAELSAAALDPQGAISAQESQLASVRFPEVPEPIGSAPYFDSLTVPGLGHVRRITVLVPTSSGPYTIVLLAELEHVDEELMLVITSLLITAPITLGLAAALAYLLAYKALAPVEQLRRLTDEITVEHLDRRLPIHNPADELGLLAQTINSMVARLENSFDEVRRFTADASHELRTPVAVIRSEAEMGADVSRNLQEARVRFRSIQEECARLAAATSQLLMLSREDAGITRSAREPVPLKPFLSEAVDSLRPLAHAKHQKLVVHAEDDAVVPADADRLRQVFHNLIDNAVKYTGPGGAISVTLTRRGAEAIVAVHDTGIGISPEHLTRVFDRFYRVDKSNAYGSDGAGLGLSIVQSIVSTLGGRVEVTSELGKGTEFRVFLPVMESAAAKPD